MLKIWIISAYKKEAIDEINRVAFDYVKSVELTGIAMPYLVPCNINNIDYYIDNLDWFIIPWWDDIDPVLYWEKSSWSIDYHKKNDEFLLKIIDKIVKKKKLLIWICKWMQLINIYFWWKLLQDIKDFKLHNQYDKQYEIVHNINIKKWSILGEVFNSDNIWVNSIHHQAISKLWKWLEVIAESDDWYIEAIVHNNYKNIIWIQWHPESLEAHWVLFQNIFKNLI